MRPFAIPERVLVRSVSDAYANCLRSDTTRAIDVVAARLQHEGYVAALRDLGIAVQLVPSAPSLPDACFIEDTAVVLAEVAIVTRPGAESRREEVLAVGEALAPHRSVHVMEGPATLDGGDVLRAGDHVFVGLSTRTNAEGAAMLGRIAGAEGLALVTLEVRGGLHLKSACTLANATTVVFDPAVIGVDEVRSFERAGLTCIEAEEPAGANVLALGGTVLVSAAAPRTAALLSAKCGAVRILDVGEMHKGDGAMTCLSLRVAARGCWST